MGDLALTCLSSLALHSGDGLEGLDGLVDLCVELLPLVDADNAVESELVPLFS